MKKFEEPMFKVIKVESADVIATSIDPKDNIAVSFSKIGYEDQTVEGYIATNLFI